MPLRKNSRTMHQMILATHQKEEALRIFQAAEKSEKIASARVELKDLLVSYIEILSIEEFKDIVLEIEEENLDDIEENQEEFKDIVLEIEEEILDDIEENQEEFKDVQGFSSSTNNPLSTDTSEDEYIEVSDDDGTIISSLCDEIIDLEFSEDGQEANEQLLKRLLKEQDIYFKSNPSDNKKCHYIRKDDKELTIQNFNEGRQQYGLLTTNNYTPPSDIVNNWERFGNKKSKLKKYDFKGENIEKVIQMIHDILD